MVKRNSQNLFKPYKIWTSFLQCKKVSPRFVPPPHKSPFLPFMTTSKTSQRWRNSPRSLHLPNKKSLTTASTIINLTLTNLTSKRTFPCLCSRCSRQTKDFLISLRLNLVKNRLNYLLCLRCKCSSNKDKRWPPNSSLRDPLLTRTLNNSPTAHSSSQHLSVDCLSLPK